MRLSQLPLPTPPCMLQICALGALHPCDIARLAEHPAGPLLTGAAGQGALLCCAADSGMVAQPPPSASSVVRYARCECERVQPQPSMGCACGDETAWQAEHSLLLGHDPLGSTRIPFQCSALTSPRQTGTVHALRAAHMSISACALVYTADSTKSAPAALLHNYRCAW